ncbi:centriole and centriolar satellite protein OFD1-like [Ptychodera flava]|uniref:centriole and centriolar satellite protein OFD1-like n=1 Tax=Ptychodera flava TaxID=63121 RepID=UPI00396A5385
MPLSTEQEELSADELKRRLFHSFRQHGTLDSLKSQLRNKLITELSLGKIAYGVPEPVHAAKHKESLMMRASNSLVADHLRRCKYDYSMSVFLPESGTAQDKLFTVRDLLQLLNINPSSKVYQNMAGKIKSYSDESFLWQLLTELASRYHGGIQDQSAQTEELPSHLVSLDDKLDSVEKAYLSKADDQEFDKSLEDKLLEYQRKLEAKSKSSLEAEISKFKDNELERVKLQEREKMRKELTAGRKELEKTYQIKLDALAERERNTLERLQKEREIMEKETFIQRQKVLEELDTLRQREGEVRREAELNAKATKIEEDKRRSMEENLRHREAAVARIEESYEHKLSEQMKSYDIEQKSKYTTRMQELEIREARNKEETRLLSDERRRIMKIRTDLERRAGKAQDLEEELDKIKKDTFSMTKQNEIMTEKMKEMVDYREVKEEVAVLRRELQNTKISLTDAQNEVKITRTRYEEEVRELRERLTKPTPELVTLQVDLNRARDKLKNEETLVIQKEATMKAKLQQELDRNKEVQKQLQDQNRQMSVMTEELNDLRSTLRETQKALSNEVYRNPKSSLPESLPLYTSRPLSRVTEVTTEFDDTDLEIPAFKPIKEDVLSISYVQDRQRSISPDLALDKFLAETKSKLSGLEQEAENLDEQYRHYRHRATNIYSLPRSKQPSLKRTSWGSMVETERAPITDVYAPSSVQSILRTSPTRSSTVADRHRSPSSSLKHDYFSPSEKLSALSPTSKFSRTSPTQKKSSTSPKSKHSGSSTSAKHSGSSPSAKHSSGTSVRVKDSSPLYEEDIDSGNSVSEKSSQTPPSVKKNLHELKPSVSMQSPRRPAPKTQDSQSPKKKEEDPLLLGGTWKSSSIQKEDHYDDDYDDDFSDGDGSHGDVVEEVEDEEHTKSEANVESPPVSLDAAWKKDEPAVSLDAAWKSGKSQEETERERELEREREREREEEKRWEEERQRKEEERRRREQEAWEREQRELEELEKQERQEKTEDKSDEEQEDAGSDGKTKDEEKRKTKMRVRVMLA